MKALLVSSLPLLLLQGAAAHPSPASSCRCRPGDPCWPSSQQWQSLNVSLGGNLVAVRPVAAVCHDPTFDAAACAAYAGVETNSSYRAAQPGALQNINWEAWPAANQSCYLGTPESLPCGQGRISLFSAEVETAAHVQAAVRFAGQNNLRLAVKNTGHCYLGRSSAPESLQIFTHRMNDITFLHDFVPQGCTNGSSYGSAVTLGAGVLAKPLYEAVAAQNLTVVVGLAHTVGPAGGYMQGGGHSPLGTLLGMAADNALEFEVVTAGGDIVVANDFQNTDLFWALRGGGGGTWGVVLSVTIRTFPDVPAYVAAVTAESTNITAFWEGIDAFHAALPGLNDAGVSGYYYVAPSSNASAPSTFTAALIFANQTDGAAVNATLAPLASVAAAVGADAVSVTPIFAPATRYFFAEALAGDSDGTGTIVALGSRLVSRDFLAAAGGAAELGGALRDITAAGLGQLFIGHIVAGGQVARNAGLDTALNPAWRRAVVHFVLTASWSVGAARQEVDGVWRNVTEVGVAKLKALEPDMGAYLNEADGYEADFQTSFWGSNYPRLLEVKQKWDPKGLFIVRRGVGSEAWDDEGLCRLH